MQFDTGTDMNTSTDMDYRQFDASTDMDTVDTVRY
jgi:hypothetical protein